MGWTLVILYGALIELVLPLAALGIILFQMLQALQRKLKSHCQ